MSSMAHRHRSVRSVALALVVVSAAAVIASQDVTLQYKWTKGEALKYRMLQETAVDMTGVPGVGQMTVQTTMTQVMSMVATDVAASGNATVQTTIESIKMDVASPAMSFSFDSTQPVPAGDPMAQQMSRIFGAIIGQAFTMVLTPAGRLEKVEGITKMMNAVGAAAPGAGMPGMDSLMSDEAMKGMFGQSFAGLPAQAVKPGDTWRQEVTVPNPLGAITSSMTNTLKGVEALNGRNVARFSTIVALKAAPGGGGGGIAGMPMTVTMSDGTGDAETWFDHGRGHMVRSVGNTVLPMTMSMTAPDGSSISMQATTKVKMTFELIEK
jgi:hypothetical protein